MKFGTLTIFQVCLMKTFYKHFKRCDMVFVIAKPSEGRHWTIKKLIALWSQTHWQYVGLEIKHKAYGFIDKYKALFLRKAILKRMYRLEETLSSVMRFTFICLSLAVRAHFGLLLFQMNIKTTFLNRELEKRYMKPAVCFEAKGMNRKCIVKRSIFDLKQSSRQWT